MQQALDRYFHISERGSTVGTEVRGGLVTFFAMAYIIILNPLILGTTEDITGQALGGARVAAVTALAAGPSFLVCSRATHSASPPAWALTPLWLSPWSPPRG